MRWIIKIILFPISLMLNILTAFLTFLLGIGTTILYFLMLMCIVAAIGSFMQKDISLGIEALILGFLLAGCLRQLGYNVKDKTTGGNALNLGGVVEECFNVKHSIEGSAGTFGKSKEDASRMILNQFKKRDPDLKSAMGVCSIQWKNAGGAGHTFSWQIINNTVKFFDCKHGINDVEISKYLKKIDLQGYFYAARLDNADIIKEGLVKYVDAH